MAKTIEAVFKRRGFDKDQPRWPRGTERGGQWRDTLGGVSMPDVSEVAETMMFERRGGSRRTMRTTSADQWRKEEEARDLVSQFADAIRAEAPRNLPSRWNGTVDLESMAGTAGGKAQDCSIKFNKRLWNEDEYKYSTLPHEWLHSVSPLRDIMDYVRMRGWEEGPIEGMTRIMRPRILERLGKPQSIDEDARFNRDLFHPYNKYINLWKDVADGLQYDSEVEGEPDLETFFWDVLALPLHERPDWVRNKGLELYGHDPESREIWLDVYDMLNEAMTSGHRPQRDTSKWMM